MLDKQIAIRIKEHSLRATVELSTLLVEIQDKVSSEDYEIIKRGIGRTIGRIQLEILDFVYYQHPELDHHKY